jgi:uncharacterized membrane protein YfcA
VIEMVAAAGIGLLAGVIAGLLGVGGGILFVPALVILLGMDQLEAESTSLLAMIPVAVVGSWRQRRYGNVRIGDGLLMGALAVGGAAAGVVVANAVPARALELSFAGLLVLIAAQMARRALTQPD